MLAHLPCVYTHTCPSVPSHPSAVYLSKRIKHMKRPKAPRTQMWELFFPFGKSSFHFFFFGFAPFSFPWGLEIRVRKKTEKKKILRQKWKSEWCFTCKGLKKHLHKKIRKVCRSNTFIYKVIVGYYFVSLTVFYYYCFYAVVFILFWEKHDTRKGIGKVWHISILTRMLPYGILTCNM